MKRRVIVVSSCAPPLEGHPVTGGGLRTQQLVQTLEGAGHQVFLMVEAAALPDDAPAALVRKAFTPDDLLEQVRSRRPSVVVVEQWAMAALLEDLDKPVAIDLHGSLLLENVYRRGELDLTLDAGAKIKALRAADLLMVPSTAQLSWFASWAAIAGFDPREPPLALLPLAMPGEPPAPRTSETPYLRMVYGGARWPWIDSLEALTVAADVAADAYGGRLDVFAFEPPRHGLPVDEELGTWPQVDATLVGRTKKGVRLRGGVSHAEFAEHLSSRATVALDLWKPNPERLLAATTRTVEYLWHGLPVITVEGADWAEALLASGAGWVVPPDDPAALDTLLRGLVEQPERIAEASRAATALAAERHTLAAAGQALLDFVNKPVCPPRTANSLTGLVIAEREAHFAVALEEQHSSLLVAHETRAEELRKGHQDEIRQLTAEHRAQMDEVTERHRQIVEGLTDKHRDELADNLIERQKEASRMLIHWQGELDKAHEAVRNADARQRKELDEAEARHRVERQADEERHRAELDALLERSRADLKEAREEHRQEMATAATGRSGQLEEAEARHRKELAEQLELHRAELKTLATEHKAEHLSEQNRHRAELEAVVDKARADSEAARAERDAEVRALVDEWSGKAADLQRQATEATDMLKDARERLRVAKHRHTEEAARLQVEIDALRVQLDEACAALDELRSRRRNRLPRMPRSPGQAARLVRLWAGHAVDRDD